ncbi:MAG: YbhB/YbcL family Raf kinase inhibitor-like protein [Gammaproteobacteria bacterium]|nr:YbhB/YbcL family Raf kinase inhibitor-like protein [Gammaproteobacteria bacterium]
MKLALTDITDQQAIPPEYAFGIIDPESHIKLGANRNPGVSWENLPEGTRSLVIICVDVDVPTVPDNVNKEGLTVPSGLLRTDFYHWVMVDIPPAINGIAKGACSDGVTAGGKQNPQGPGRQGINDYTGWFANDADMKGEYYGYDGPCPPWNDELVHNYHFVLYATDLESCPVEGAFTGIDVEHAIAGHILDEVRVTATYTLNPDLA